MTTDMETYLSEGCGRCPLGGTPDCKVHRWTGELTELRRIMQSCGLHEEIKWGAPCYTYQKANVLMISAFKDSCVLSFFKGSLLKDEQQVLEKPGANSQAARFFRFTDVSQVLAQEATIKAYVFEAIEVEKAGLKVQFKKNPEPVPEELKARLDQDPILQAAYEALTPGRQRSYIIHIGQAKQSATRAARVEKCVPRIMEGKGFHDR